MDPAKIWDESIQLKEPIIYIAEDTEPPLYKKVALAFAYLVTKGSPDLKIIIDSNGGSTSVGLDIYDLIRLYPGKTTGLVISKAASMAAIILQACKVRTCAIHAEVLIHHISRRSVSLDTLVSPSQRKKLVTGMKLIQQQQYKILMARTKRL